MRVAVQVPLNSSTWSPPLWSNSLQLCILYYILDCILYFKGLVHVLLHVLLPAAATPSMSPSTSPSDASDAAVPDAVLLSGTDRTRPLLNQQASKHAGRLTAGRLIASIHTCMHAHSKQAGAGLSCLHKGPQYHTVYIIPLKSWRDAHGKWRSMLSLQTLSCCSPRTYLCMPFLQCDLPAIVALP